MPYRAWFQCINPECGETYPLNSIVYQCKRCNSLLEVQHDTKELARHSGQEWKELFEKRYKSNEWPYGSGVWGKKEWVLPEVAPENVVSLYEGGTNLFWAERFGKVKKTYIECLEDRAIPIAGQRAMQSHADFDAVVSMPTDHSPFYSAPERLAEALARTAA